MVSPETGEPSPPQPHSDDLGPTSDITATEILQFTFKGVL